MSTATSEQRVPPLTLGWRLQMSLRHAGLKRDEMAARLEVSDATVTRWMHDKGSAPRRPFLAQWALATGVPVEWLVDGVVTEVTPPPEGEPTTTPDALTKLANKKRARYAETSATRRYASAA